MPTQLPNDAVAVGYKEIRPYHHEQVFQSESAGFTGTESKFVEAGHGYEYDQTTPHTRSLTGVSLPRVNCGEDDLPSERLEASDEDDEYTSSLRP